MVRLLMFHGPNTRRFAAQLSDDSQPERREAGTEEDAFFFFFDWTDVTISPTMELYSF